MDAETVSTAGQEHRGIGIVSVGLWIALAGAVLQFSAISSDFYRVGDNVRDAWFGIPHTSDLILLSALTTVVLLALSAAGRSPVNGRMVGVLVGVVGLLATAQLGYRMVVPPFQGCLTFNCGFTPKSDVTLLTGIWIGLVGNIAATVGGFLHAASGKAKRTPANFWVAERQTGMTPWLGIAGLSAALMFVVGFTAMPFYTVPTGDGSMKSWTAWLAIPHSSSLVLLLAVGVVGLVIAAARGRAPMSPMAVGVMIAALGFTAGFRTLYRILVSPFYSGPAAGVFGEGVQVHTIAYLALGFAVITMVAGAVHAAQHRESEPVTATGRVAGEPAS